MTVYVALTETIGSNIIQRNENIVLNKDEHTHKLKDRLNLLIKIWNDEFKEVEECDGAELSRKMEGNPEVSLYIKI